MAQVQTVTGPIEAEELGTTLIHEHLRNADEAVHNQWPQAGAAKEEPPHEVAPGEDYDIAVREAKAAVDLGIKTIGEPTAMFLGRDVNFMRRVSEETGLQVVPCTGIYTYDYLPQFFLNRDPDQIAEFFVADIEQGIQGTDIRAAFIKCAADEPGVNENIEKIHRAAARASVKTGAPIMAHSRPASNTGPRQIEIFLEEGVEPSKIQMAHTGDTDDLDYIEGAAREGRLDRAGPLRPRHLPAVREAAGDGEGAARAWLRRSHLPLGRLGRHHRLVSLQRDRAADRLGGRERVDDPHRSREGPPRAPRIRDDRSAGADDDGRQRGPLAHRLDGRAAAPPTELAPLSEEGLEQGGRAVGEQASFDRWPMVDHRLGEQVDHASHGASLRVGGAVDESRDPCQGDGARAHRAGLERHVDGGLEQSPATQPLRPLAQGEHLGVGGRIAAQLSLVSSRPQNLVAARHHGADGDVTVRRGPLGQLQGRLHVAPIGLCEVRRHHR